VLLTHPEENHPTTAAWIVSIWSDERGNSYNQQNAQVHLGQHSLGMLDWIDRNKSGIPDKRDQRVNMVTEWEGKITEKM
jgi:hypothetical protein